MTGKAAEIAAMLTRLPLDTDFFKRIEDDLVVRRPAPCESRALDLLRPAAAAAAGRPGRTCGSASHGESRLVRRAAHGGGPARRGGREPKGRRRAGVAVRRLARPAAPARDGRRGRSCSEEGVPLRAMVAYLFGEVAKNFYLIHHPDEWIEYVTRSQRGDCCVEIDPGSPARPRGHGSGSSTGSAGLAGRTC